MMRVRSIVTAAALLAAPLVAAATPVAAADNGIDTSDRGAVTAAYRDVWQPTLEVPVGWTGSVAGCNAGTVSDAAQTATLQAVNFVRSLAGLTPASFILEYNEQAQAAALLMRANNALDHHPPASWECYSQAGADGAHGSNLYLQTTAARAVAGYLVDPGDSNTSAGHRRWILNPSTVLMGHGSTDGSDALKVFGSRGETQQFVNPQWVSWPTAGWFPVELEPAGRWSLSAPSGVDADYSQATVSVTDSGGTALPVQVYPQRDGYGADTLVWKVTGLDYELGTGERDYTVSVSGIRGAVPASTSYTVRLFDPEPAATPTPDPTPTLMPRLLVKPATVGGTAKVGKRLTAVASWSPAATTSSYRWYRNGKAIAKATKQRYTLTKQDRKTRISVKITVPAADGYGAASTTAKLPAKVR